MQHVNIYISSSKLEFNDEILLLHIDSLKVIKPALKKNQSPDDVLLLADIKSMSITLNNPKKNFTHTFVQIDTTTVNMTLRNKDKKYNENLEEESMMAQELKDKATPDDTHASTPASESRSDDMFAENIEAEVNNQKQMASAAASLIIDAQKMNVVLNKEQFDLIQKLINDLSVGIATATNPSPFSSQILNSQSPQTPMPLSSIDEDEDVGPDFAVQLLVRDICVTLNDLASPSLHSYASKHTLQLNLKEFMTMISMYQFAAPLIKVQVQAEDVNIYEIFKNPDKKVPILRGFKKLVKEYRSNKSAFITSISYKKMPILAKILVKMQLNGLFLNFYQELPEDLWIMCLLSFITTTEQTDAQSITSVYVVMHDCVADYAPIHIPSRLVACLNRTMFATQIVTTAKDMSFNVTLEGASVHLHDKFQQDIINYLEARPHESSEFGFVNDLKNLEFVQIASLNSLSICVKMTTAPTVDNPAMAIDISNGTVLVDTCADSFNTLRELLTYFANQQDIADKVALVTKWKLDNAPKPVAPVMTTAPPPSKIKPPNAKPERPKKPSILMDSLDEDFFDKAPVALPPKGNAPSAVKSAPKKINLNTFVVEDHFPASTSADAGLKRDLPKDYPVPEFEVIINDKVEIVITMYGGYDWGELASKHNKSSSALIKKTTLRSNRDVTRMIECKVADIFVQFTLCKVSDPVAWRARVSVKDFEVIDKIKKSTRHKIASFMKNSDKPREFNSRMLDFVFESVRPNFGVNDAQEFKMRLDILPIRINIHEEALIFLLEFLDVPNPFKKQEATTTTTTMPAKPPAQDDTTVFKSVEISPIHLKIDYEPSKVEYGQIAMGNFAALLNVAQIKGLEVSLSAVKLKNVQGVDSFVQQVTQVYINDVMGTQLFRFLLGFMPVRAVYNVGSGVYDLIAFPIDQYNRDGSLLRGFRRGVVSCVSGIAQGTAGITAVAANTATQVLKGVTNMLEDPDEAHVTTPAMPAGAMEGVHHAYASVSDGLQNAKMAVVALPRVYQTKGVASVFKSVPQVILSPIIGTTDALTKLLYGVQHSLSKQDKNEFSDVYKQ